MRIPLIPGINDTEEELGKIAQIALDYLKPPRRVNILPYHRFGMGKYSMLDREYSLPELITQNDLEIQKDKSFFESLGLECEIVL
jgi:pyruvate formate lyase activating enzyme